MSKSRRKPADQRTRAIRPATRDKAEEAWLLKLRGESLEDIGETLEMSPSGVHELLTGYVAGRPLASVETFRHLLLCRLDDAHKKALAVFDEAKTAKAQNDTLRVITGIARTAAVISGAVKTPPPVVMVNQFSQGPDLSRLSIDEVESLQRMQTKLLEAPIVAHGEAVDDGES